ncbi:DUF551 domain-containing protein [Citrobacter portucalensis]|nr:DUF551 domain-containing protein [Citrobacter portucalensis]MDN4386147.1 DUF551 domain-containing protein [Citrobacter portucalensis]MDN4406511.1 DUF551 domain-containing protein [Citrobacter portucalensis]MDN4446058.1 DUF551 domain-containing protein [Citrobacter portucalensis]
MTTNHPAHGPVSLDRLHQISEILSKAVTQSDGGNLGCAMADAVKVIDGVIAARNAEPVAYMTYKGYLLHAADPKLPEYSDPTPLYDAPPVPVVTDELLSMAASAIEDLLEHTDPSTSYYSGVCADVPGKLRAAMLQAGNSPVTPDGWIPVCERMPNDKDFVWCFGYVSGWTESDGFEAYYDATRNKWWTVDDETVRKVTHWMPLPAAPQQEVNRG